MSVGTYDTAVLSRVIQSLFRPGAELLDLFFPNEQTEENSEEIHFDVDESKPRIAPFVSPLRAGVVMTEDGFRTDSFKPAYVKPKHILDPSRPLKRTIGEPITGNMSPQQRRDAHIRKLLMLHLGMLTVRENVMASEELRTGKVTVSGEGYPTKVVDFGRHADLTVALLTTARWGETGVDPLTDLETWLELVQDKSGAIASTVVMDTKAWKLAKVSPKIEKLLNQRRGTNIRGETGPVVPNQKQKLRSVLETADLEIFVYNDIYVDEAGVVQKILPDHTVIMGSRDSVEGVRAYGTVQDEKAGYRAERIFSKSWLEEDPAVRYVLSQSAPLVVPYRPNATFCATVR